MRPAPGPGPGRSSGRSVNEFFPLATRLLSGRLSVREEPASGVGAGASRLRGGRLETYRKTWSKTRISVCRKRFH